MLIVSFVDANGYLKPVKSQYHPLLPFLGLS